VEYLAEAGMRTNPTLYLESTIPSYLAARPSRDIIVAAHQQLTHQLWEEARPGYDVYISQTVLDEILAGDPDAAARRLAYVETLPLLDVNEEVESLAEEYRSQLNLPRAARVDATHLACAVVYEVDFMLTWNCAHLANWSGKAASTYPQRGSRSRDARDRHTGGTP
jgi:hypothetical protein